MDTSGRRPVTAGVSRQFTQKEGTRMREKFGTTLTRMSFAAIAALLAMASVRETRAQTCIQPPSGLVGWWPGDNHTNDIANDNPGTLLNGVVLAPGYVGPAFQLDGGDDAVQIPEVNTDLDGFSQLTSDAWIYPTTVTGTIVSKYDTTINGASYAFSIANGVLAFAVIEKTWSVEPGPLNCNAAVADTRLAVIESGPTAIPANTWSHVAGVWAGGQT